MAVVVSVDTNETIETQENQAQMSVRSVRTTKLPPSLDVETLFELVYPIGSVYTTVNSESPEVLFGGKWEQIKDTFLLAAGDTYAAGDTGGEAEHTLTISEMPEHSHSTMKPTSTTNRVSTTTSSSSSNYKTYYGTSSSDTGSTGDGDAHNNMPPYLTVYMWKRTA